jgi:drug/metabolite transporter (DMT)-like permease
MKPPTRQHGYLLVAGLSLFWGISWPVMKIALMEIPPWTFRTLSLVCGGAGILILARLSGVKLSIPRGQLAPLVAVAAFNVTGWHLGSAYGISLMESGRASVLGFTMPLWAAILSTVVLKEKLSVQKIAGLVLGLTGLYVLLEPQISSIGKTPAGVVFMLGAALSWGTGTVLMKYFKWTMPTLLLTGWQLALGSLPVVVGAVAFEPALVLSALSYNALLAMLYVIAFPMLFCHWAWFTVVGIFPASVAAISTLAVPVIGVISGAFFLGESLGGREVAALALVTTALAVVLLWRGNAHVAAQGRPCVRRPRQPSIDKH